MPLYDYECHDCNIVTERYEKSDVYEIQCPACMAPAKRIISSRYNVIGDIEFVTDNITGKPERITSRKRLRRLLAENGLYERYGKGWR